MNYTTQYKIDGSVMKILIFLLFYYFVFPVKAQSTCDLIGDNPLKTGIDSSVYKCVCEIFSEKKFVGLSLGIYKDDTEFYYNYGKIEKYSDVAPTAATVYEIGSITKTFTGVLLAQAVLNNKIKLDDDIRVYLKEEYDNLEYYGVPIRIINLANHTSGLPEDIYPESLNELENPTMFDIVNIFNDDNGLMFLKDLHNVTLETQPGEQFKYSNVGIIILGHILENIYETSYSELLKRFITHPLGMTNTETVFFESDTSNYTKGYDTKGNIMPHITFQIAGAAGGLKSTANDMMNYLKANVRETDRAIKLAHEKTFSDENNGIGLGWQIKQSSSGDQQLWHDGGEPGFSTYCMVIPQKIFGIICLMNQKGFQSELCNLSEKIFTGLNSIK